MYPEYMEESLRKVVQTRPARLELARKTDPVYPPMNAKERRKVLEDFHPDFKEEALRKVRVGPNKGEKLTTEVADMLESHSWLRSEQVDLKNPDFETDLLIIGGGGAGCNAALVAMQQHGVRSLIATKLRMGDANPMMSQGGMQAAVSPTDSPTKQYLDGIGGGASQLEAGAGDQTLIGGLGLGEGCAGSDAADLLEPTCHPFVTAPGYNAYYLNVLAGSARSFAASDDPKYAHLRKSWPQRDPRVPLVHPEPAIAGARN